MKEAEAAGVLSTASKDWAPATPAPVCSEELFASFFFLRSEGEYRLDFILGAFHSLYLSRGRMKYSRVHFKQGSGLPWTNMQAQGVHYL